MKEILQSYGALQQVCSVPTRKGATLELILTDLHTFYHPPTVLAPLTVDSDNLASAVEMLGSSRLQTVRSLRLRVISEELLQVLADNLELEEVDMSDTMLLSIQPTFLTALLPNLATGLGLALLQFHVENVLHLCPQFVTSLTEQRGILVGRAVLRLL